MVTRTSKTHRNWQRLKAWWVTRSWYRKLFAEFGPRSRIAPPLHVRHPEFVVIGSGSSLGTHCRLETQPPQTRSNKPVPLIRIGDRVRIGGGVRLSGCVSLTIENGAWIEDGCTITDCEYGGAPDGPAYYRQRRSGRPTLVGEGAWIGAGSTVLAGARIGRRAIILPGSVVDGDIPPCAVAAGVPATVIRAGNGQADEQAHEQGQGSEHEQAHRQGQGSDHEYGHGRNHGRDRLPV